MFGTLYIPEIEGLPFLVVIIENGRVIDVESFYSREDAEAYLSGCDAGMAADLVKEKGRLHT